MGGMWGGGDPVYIHRMDQLAALRLGRPTLCLSLGWHVLALQCRVMIVSELPLFFIFKDSMERDSLERGIVVTR